MKVISQLILKFLLVLAFLTEAVAIISGAGIAAVVLVKFIKPSLVHLHVDIYDIQVTDKLFAADFGTFLMLLILALLLLISLGLGANSLRQLIFKILHKQYFTVTNLRLVRLILGCSGMVVATQILWQLELLLHNESLKLSNLGLMLIVTAIIYVLELLFAHGVQLQLDNESLI
ncbi:hypothetical protein [Bombilactobacillus bombi]|uniref:hypothetical protein n=1 Tax=Bombilactobacillus bombi TaxID=1303590 RepID=UPI0015E5B8B4|nr:hypothetical protein [Bombilactobacillus bombi]MBA1434389.1 hypothetical protein [Bombilactobacillus bombi]